MALFFVIINFNKFLGQNPLGYRAPQGVIKLEDLDLLLDNGYSFSSSIFPSYRLGKFNNLRMPIMPFLWNNGLLEIPFAVIPGIRLIYSLSYIKLFSLSISKALTTMFGLPNVVVIDSHLHDLFYSPDSLKKVNGLPRYAWSIRKNDGQKYLNKIIEYLKLNDYEFVSISDLYKILKVNI